jgi:hypothetical protein
MNEQARTDIFSRGDSRISVRACLDVKFFSSSRTSAAAELVEDSSREIASPLSTYPWVMGLIKTSTRLFRAGSEDTGFVSP